jgi:hypothetical protein
MGNVRGTGWKNNEKFILEQYSRVGYERIVAALGEKDQEIFLHNAGHLKWLDCGAFMRFMLAADKVVGQGDMEVVKAASIYCARKDLGGLYKVFIAMTSPRVILRNATQLWGKYYDCGEMTMVYEKEKSAGLKLTNFPDVPLYHEFNLIPYMLEAGRFAGAVNPQGTHSKCMARGDDHCLFEFTWE